MIQRNNICSSLSRYRGFYGTLWSFARPQAVITAKSRTASGLVASTFYKFRSIIRFVLGKAPLEFRHAITSSSFHTVRQVSQTTVRSPFITRLVTGRKIPLGESYFKNATRFRNINRRFLINSGFSFALVGLYAKPDTAYTAPEKRSTWQNAFNIVKNHHFQLKEIREDIDSVEKITFQAPISKGCNGVVYKGEIPASSSTQGEAETEKSQKVAIKMLFNYDIESNSALILNSFIKETLPYPGQFGDNLPITNRKALSPHPNIVKILSVFAGDFQLLPGFDNLYPMAIPRRFGGYGRNMTLFIVERLYDMSLKDYLELVPKPSKNVSLGMLAQLLDGVDFLHQNQVAHRDLKPDNILVKIEDTSDLERLPWLVITDFGLASNSLKIPFPTDEIGKGGNRALMAPEIVNTKPGRQSFLDYCRSDIWAVGTIAYELFGADNPFYRKRPGGGKIDSARYDSECLPEFPSNCRLLKALINNILAVEPEERPSPSFASTFCHLLLYMGPKNLRRLAQVNNDSVRIAITKHWWQSFMTDLITQTWNSDECNMGKALDVNEHQLRVHFVSNVTAGKIVETVDQCRQFC